MSSSRPQVLWRTIPDLIANGIEERLGFRPAVLLRTADELRDVVRHNPFLDAVSDPKSLLVAFLSEVPGGGKVARLDPDYSPPDAFPVRGREIFLHYPNGSARGRLTNSYFDSRLATTSTIRNWRTVLKLLEMAEGR